MYILCEIPCMLNRLTSCGPEVIALNCSFYALIFIHFLGFWRDYGEDGVSDVERKIKAILSSWKFRLSAALITSVGSLSALITDTPYLLEGRTYTVSHLLYTTGNRYTTVCATNGLTESRKETTTSFLCHFKHQGEDLHKSVLYLKSLTFSPSHISDACVNAHPRRSIQHTGWWWWL